MARDDTIRRRTYLKGAGAAGSVAITGLAGCTLGGDGGNGGDDGGDSGGDSGSDGTDSGTETTDSGDDTTPLTIAATVPETGAFSSLGQDLRRGYELGVERMNQNLDREVELIIRDDESDAQTLREQLQAIVSNNDVNMIWGSFSSLLVTAGSAFAENQNLPFIGIAFAYEEPHRNDNYEWTFAPFPKSRDVARSTLGTIELLPEEDRPTNIGIWEPNSGWGEEQANYWEDVLTEAGYDVVMREVFEIGSSDFSTLISQAQNADVEALLSNPTPGGGITAVNQMSDSGWAPDMLKFVRGADPSAWWSALGQAGAYALMCPGWVPGLTGNGNAQLRETFFDAYDTDAQYMPVNVGGSYNLTQVAEQAVSAAGSVEPEAVRDALRNTEFETVIGTFSFEDNGLPSEGELTAPTGQWWDGAQRLVFPDTDSERALDFRYPIPPWSER
ncbi:amino acid ABC transporter substrate-binding protein [Halobellus clavatus]|uniref:ABC-type branched-chain amino acid transport system, substrate-binding protein n=1 Tax=Halobellus clavatus TaxID=660517 RepID=A0A1H3H1A4_9EURY|nr:amino acid ABC transporter substrate-binding protein [Halobellus clavatus]SDY08544.1 ABC-type branched-chain amino acid transport system, substrate-binding protein [Halobellus clavatus]